MGSNERITLIIPTFERREWIISSLRFWAEYPVRVLVLDGSTYPTVQSHELVKFANVSYFHLPVSLEKRFLFVSDKINTPYASLLSDDELFLHSALHSATHIMDKHRNVSAVVGATLGFKKINSEFLWRYEYKTIKNLKVTATNPLKRLRQRQKTRGNSIYYSLARSEVLSAGLRFIGENEFSCPYIQEYQLESAFCLAGEVRFMPKLMWLRNRGSPMVDLLNAPRDSLFEHWLKLENNQPHIARLKNSFECFSRDFDKTTHMSGQVFIDLFGKDSTPLSRWVSYLKSALPEIVYFTLRKVYRSAPKLDTQVFRSLYTALEDLRTDGIMVNDNEFEEILLSSFFREQG